MPMPVGTLVVRALALTFPNGTRVDLAPNVVMQLGGLFATQIASYLKPWQPFERACVGHKPEDDLPGCAAPSEAAFRSNPESVAALRDLLRETCPKTYAKCENSSTCDSDGYEHGRLQDYVAACQTITGRMVCIRKAVDDVDWTKADADRCAHPTNENDCAPLSEYVRSFKGQNYLECFRLHPFHGFHWTEAQAALAQGVPQCDAIMVARVSSQCEVPSAYDSCDELVS
jgi:hypothetical protein